MKSRISPCVTCGPLSLGLCIGGRGEDDKTLGARVVCHCCGHSGTNWNPAHWKDAWRRAVHSWNREMRSCKLRQWVTRHPRVNHCRLLKWLFVQYCRVDWWLRDFVQEWRWRLSQEHRREKRNRE